MIMRFCSPCKLDLALADGFVCQNCNGDWHSQFRRRDWHQLGGAVIESSKLEPTRFLAMHRLTQAKSNVSALELDRRLDISELPPGCSSNGSVIVAISNRRRNFKTSLALPSPSAPESTLFGTAAICSTSLIFASSWARLSAIGLRGPSAYILPRLRRLRA